jgi:Glycosyl hydrolase family 20, catalytic domain
MWSEVVDVSVLDATVWPRTAAFADIFWSDESETLDPDSAEPRIHQFRCLLLE